MASIKTLKNIVNKGALIYSNMIVSLGRISYSRGYKSIPSKPGEKEWIKKWKILQKKPQVNCYRKYADISNDKINIIPMDLMNTVIQPILNPNIFRPYYLDKNTFDIIYGKENLPVTIARRMNGEYYDGDYKSFGEKEIPFDKAKDYDSLIAKPSRDSYGGRNILLFHKNEDGIFRWNENPDRVLSVSLLDELLGQDWVLQERLKQHDFMAQFNESSVNTFRVHIYKSPVTGKTVIAGMCMRVGAKGNWYDNVHNGGFCVSVDIDSGKLGKITADGNGDLTNKTNGIDFRNLDLYVPNFENLKKFAIEMGNKVHHHHSLAADIMMDENGNYKLIEINIGTFEANMYMASGTTAFGKYTDEVIEYCKSRKNKVKFVHVIPW